MIESHIEPHKDLLVQPNDDQLLYKVMRVEDLIDAMKNRYLYFNRIDSYSDFPCADKHDGEQLQQDRSGNTACRFEKAPSFSVADSYDLSRKRTYACCFSLENSDYIWNTYGNNSDKGKVCLVIEFGKLRKLLNETFNNPTMNNYSKIFSLNYGIIQYENWNKCQKNQDRFPNAIKYFHLKDSQYEEEKEFRITLSALGVYKYTLPERKENNNEINFPESQRLAFDHRKAIEDGTIQQILLAQNNPDSSFFIDELQKMGVYSQDLI